MTHAKMNTWFAELHEINMCLKGSYRSFLSASVRDAENKVLLDNESYGEKL